MANKAWCRLYTGIANSDVCEAGIEYQSVRNRDQRPHRWPCTSPELRDTCAAYECWTDKEVAETERAVAQFVEAVNALSRGESDTCPHCGQQITSMRQVGRCVYASCGCRLWQGRVPEAWRE